MRKKYLLFIIIIFILTFFFLFLFIGKSKKAPINPPKYSYVVQEYDGKIGVFRISEKKPFQIIDMSTLLLPDFDREELKTGIYIKDEAQLQQILEDYVS